MENNNKPKEAEQSVVPAQTNLPAHDRLNPREEIAFATEAAKALMEVVNQKHKKVVIRGEQYLEFEDWQTIGRFYNVTVGVAHTSAIKKDGEQGNWGYVAKANVFNAQGNVISSAEASCTKDEPKWAKSPDFQMRSMAQTRASSKALRNVLAWVVVLAGFKSTPAEEMDGVKPYNPQGGQVQSYKPQAKPADAPVQSNREHVDKLIALCKKHGHEGETIGQTIERLTGQKVTGNLNNGKAKALLEMVIIDK